MRDNHSCKAIGRSVFLAAVCAALSATSASGQTDDRRPIRIIVPYAPGGQVDLMARVIATQLAKNLDVPVVVDNRSGASGLIGMHIALSSSADAKTLVMASATPMAILPHTQAKKPYDPMKDFTAISLVSSSPYVLVVPASSTMHSVADLIQLAKAKPGNLLYGSAGQLTGSHLTTELFNLMAGVQTVNVAYKGSAPATVELMSGQLTFLFNNLLPSLPHIKSARLRALGVTTATRNRTLPDVPTIAETVKGYESSAWNGLVAPGHPPKAAIANLHAEIVRALNVRAVREGVLDQGSDVIGSSPAEFTELIRMENTKWLGVLQKVKLD